MNEKIKYLISQGCQIRLNSIHTSHGCYVGLVPIIEDNQDKSVNFIYQHKLTQLDGIGGGCNPVCIGFNEEEKAWYAWTNFHYKKFYVTDCEIEETKKLAINWLNKELY